MTQDEIIEMAKKAGFTRLESYGNKLGTNPTECLEAFAKMVAAKEREECAKVCEAMFKDACADAIRARGQE